ncbi:probable RNA-directed DNA polymerase from transposon BS [Palaemon carinicauda]|uniref:probable RNA-directed DNA polymerase from transposon BS n=1 Tax=Palaemon carinicauda TaxID=392227 RepID=UPI0035B602AF
MEQHPLKILTWNVNGIRNKHIEVQHFCLENDLDIICLQETKHTDANKYQIRGYQMYTVDSLMRQSPYRGMITYIKNSIPVSYSIDVTLGEDTNSQLFNIHDEKGNIKIKIMNVYITDNKLDFSGLHEIVDGHPCILVGDLNAVHYKLGDNSLQPYNNNGKKFMNHIESESNIINVINGPEPTHLQGNKLDYVCLVNDPGLPHHCEIVDTLTSDHFGVYGEIMLPDTTRRHIVPRKRLKIPKKHEGVIKNKMNNWYASYTVSTTDDLNRDMVAELENCIESVTNPKKKMRTTIGTMKRWYNSDPAVKRIDKQYKKVKKRWENNPTEQNLLIFKRMAQQVQDVKVKSREKYWIAFLQSMDHNTPFRQISRKVKIVQGERRREGLHPNPTEKCNELMEEWAQSSSYDCLPLKVRSALAKNLKRRLKKIQEALRKYHPSDKKPISQEEFRRCLKNGKSTAPGMDGVTYDIIRFLATVHGNPVLRLYNMIWSGGSLPKMWKRAIMIPVPKHGRPGSFRPISLTSCLCKIFERIILNRMMHTIKRRLSCKLWSTKEFKYTLSAYCIPIKYAQDSPIIHHESVSQMHNVLTESIFTGLGYMGYDFGRFREFMKRNMVIVIMVPVIVGFHYGWQKLQENEKFVPKRLKRDLPVIEGAKYLEGELKSTLGLKKE